MKLSAHWGRSICRAWAATGVLALMLVASAGPAHATVRHLRRSSGDVDPFTTSAIRSYLADRSGNITAALYNLKTDKTYLLRPDVTEQTASIIKVTILGTLLDQAQSAHRSLTDDEKVEATGMIEDSDDDDATDLWDDVGESSAISSFDERAGLTDTTPNTDGYWGETTTTALDQIRILQHIVSPNDLLDAASRHYELNLMEHVESLDYWGISNGVPAGTTVALKNGWVPIVNGNWQINTIGYVSGAHEQYLLAVLTNENSSEYYGIGTVDSLGELVWKALDATG